MLLKIEDLDVSFRNDEGEVTEAAIDVNLTLERGEVLGIVGESGSGKSSVSMSVARLLPSPPAFYPKGRILLDGVDTLTMPLADLRRLRGKRIGVVFQDPMGSLSPLHRIGDQLVETILLHEQMSKAAARAHALEWLGKVGIPDPEQRALAYPHELSGGMQQRVALARAFAMDTDILLMDEPFGAIDPQKRIELQELSIELCKKSRDKKTVVFITHDIDEALVLADKVYFMEPHKIKKEVLVGLPTDAPREELIRMNRYNKLRREFLDLFSELKGRTA